MSNYRGAAFVRTTMAMTEGANVRNALSVAEKRWGSASQVTNVLKAVVAAGTLTDDVWAGNLAEAQGAQLEFLEVVRPLTILGKLANLRRVPVRAPVAAQASGAIAYWTGEGQIKPVTSAAFNRRRLEPTKVVGLVVISGELSQFGTEAEVVLRDDLARASALATDIAFIDPSNPGVSGARPAAVTADAVTIASSGSTADNIRTDVEAAVAAFTGNLTTASWVTHPRAAVSMGLRLGAAGVANDLGALGGTLAGLPVITSEAVPFDSTGTSLTLLDAAGILHAEEGIRAMRSTQSAIAMTDTPGEGPLQMVSLWQTNSIALVVERTINWEVGRAGSVVVVTGLNYGA